MTQIYTFFLLSVVSVFKGNGARVILITFLIATYPTQTKKTHKNVFLPRKLSTFSREATQRRKCCRFVFLSCAFLVATIYDNESLI